LRQQDNSQTSPPCKDAETNSIQQNDCEWVRALRGLRTTDAFVGEAFTYLRKQGELENTYVFFYTDNGNHWGEHRLDEGKMTPYETDINFSLLVRVPGVPKGRVVSRKLVGTTTSPPPSHKSAQRRPPPSWTARASRGC
jgi:membrane-anchored protein YejM (alkaline phosphatase superfamily)